LKIELCDKFRAPSEQSRAIGKVLESFNHRLK
jgi:hypothetical protein